MNPSCLDEGEIRIWLLLIEFWLLLRHVLSASGCFSLHFWAQEGSKSGT